MPALVHSVSRSAEHGFCKQPQSEIELIVGEGVAGDAHRGRTTQHLYRVRQDPTQPNLCQVHLLGAEMLDELRGKGYDLTPGELGENILTCGIDLLALPLGAVLLIGDEAVLEVTGLRTPCSEIDKFCAGLQQHMWGERDAGKKRARRAGIMSVVRIAGTVRAGDAICVEMPPAPHRPLPPV